VTKHLTGLSWSLDPDYARLFPTLNGYIVSDPVREEQEIVTFKARRQLVESILGGDSLK
jgi:hypothetical protein